MKSLSFGALRRAATGARFQSVVPGKPEGARARARIPESLSEH